MFYKPHDPSGSWGFYIPPDTITDMRNPSGTRDELILALDTYFRYPDARCNRTHPKVAELSRVQNQSPIHPHAAQGVEFRNPNGVSMKLASWRQEHPGVSPHDDGDGAQALRGLKDQEIHARRGC
jgi:hypothetical protein